LRDPPARGGNEGGSCWHSPTGRVKRRRIAPQVDTAAEGGPQWRTYSISRSAGERHMGRRVNFSRRAGIALLFPAALLAACGRATTTPTATSSAASGPGTQATIAAAVHTGID